MPCMTPNRDWHGKPYYSLDAYCKNTYGEKLYKIALDADFTCPNRDGTLDTRGCIFCSAGGSGDFAVQTTEKFSMQHTQDTPKPTSENPVIPATESFTLFSGKTDKAITSLQASLQQGLSYFGDKKLGSRFIAYFQAYTNTYGPIDYLDAIYRQALQEPSIAGISIATRPDCLPDEVLSLLAQLQAQYPEKFIWVELGLQTIHERTATYIRRGYPLSVFESALKRLQAHSIPVIVHLILGLPDESDAEMLQSVTYLNDKPIFGVKLQLLHILRGTDLAKDYQAGTFQALDKEHYIALILSCLSHLSPDIVIHRLTGDGPKELLLAPLFSRNKRDVLNTIHKECRLQQIWQGKNYHDTGTFDAL